MSSVKEFSRTTPIVLAKELKKDVMDIMKVTIVHRNLGANRGLDKLVGTTAPKPSPSSAIPAPFDMHIQVLSDEFFIFEQCFALLSRLSAARTIHHIQCTGLVQALELLGNCCNLKCHFNGT